MADSTINWRRRALIAGGLAAPIALAATSKPRDRGRGGHDAYFADIQNALKRAGLMHPTLVIDRARLDANIARLQTHLPPELAYRIVAKSLPSVDLIR